MTYSSLGHSGNITIDLKDIPAEQRLRLECLKVAVDAIAAGEGLDVSLLDLAEKYLKWVKE